MSSRLKKSTRCRVSIYWILYLAQNVVSLTQVAPAMFEEEEEQQQDVGPLKAALEDAAAAAEAQGRSRQPGQPSWHPGPSSSSCLLFDPLLEPQPVSIYYNSLAPLSTAALDACVCSALMLRPHHTGLVWVHSVGVRTPYKQSFFVVHRCIVCSASYTPCVSVI